MTSRSCPNCSASVDATSRFCVNCGHEVGPLGAEQNGPGTATAPGLLQRVWQKYWRWPIWARVLIALFAIGLVGAPFSKEPPKTASAKPEAAAPIPTQPGPSLTPGKPVTSSPTAHSTKVATPPPSPQPSEADLLRDRLTDLLGDSNRDVKRFPDFSARPGGQVYVKVAFNDNLTEGLVKNGVRLDCTEMLQAIRESGFDFRNVFIEGTFLMQDKYGNASEDTVVRASWSRRTVYRINFENFYFKEVFDVATSAWIHPAFQY